MTLLAGTVREVTRTELQPWLPYLDAWLLPGAFYGVRHTWPQLYRSDGEGRFFVLADGDRLLSHCACRVVVVRSADGPFRACLLGSVATEPSLRGQGLASQVLAAAVRAMQPRAEHVLLWAERPELYARAGFGEGLPETLLLLARRPRTALDGVRNATHADHEALARLHAQKPWRVERSPGVMSGLLTTPGMRTVVLERGGAPVAYACCGKGADLQGHWHEVGGSDEDVALLLPAAMHATDQIEAALLLPPYRRALRELLGRSVTGEATIPGPMVRSPGAPLPACWIDGLDSV